MAKFINMALPNMGGRHLRLPELRLELCIGLLEFSVGFRVRPGLTSPGWDTCRAGQLLVPACWDVNREGPAGLQSDKLLLYLERLRRA